MGAALESQAAHVLRLVRPGVPADAALRAYLSGRAGVRGGEGRQVSRAVYSYYRWLGWLEPRGSAQARIAAALEMQGRFERDPASVKAEALRARAVPEWLGSEMDLPTEYLRSLQREPPLWIRAKVAGLAAVAAELDSCSPPALPAALRAPPGLAALRYGGQADLHLAAGYRSGAFEIQDLSSQLVGHACGPAPGETWWDACAGEGGKTLHLGDLMGNKGLVWATDRSQRRLAALRRRAARAGMFNCRWAAWEGIVRPPFGAACDGVLVDAPCSGVGTWQRNPHARWTTSQKDVRELASVQAGLLAAAARAVKPGGRLVYAVCTLTRSETAEVADGFGVSHPGFEPWPLPITEAGLSRIELRPEDIGANGMYIAAWRRAR